MMATETRLPDVKERINPPLVEAGVELTSKEDEVSLLDLLIVLAERKRIIIRTTVAFAIIAIVVSLLLPKRYTATVTLLPPQQNSSMSNLLASQLGGLGGMAALATSSLGLKNPNDMYVSMLKSRTVEDAMVQRFGLQKEYGKRYLSDARKTFEKRAIVDGSGKDNMIQISIEDGDATHAAEIANGYVDQFRDLSEHLAITEASQRRLFFEQQLERAKDNLANAEEAMKKTEESTGLIQIDSQARALIEASASLRAQIAGKEVQIQGMQTYASAGNAELMQSQEELESLRGQLAKLGGSESPTGGELIVPKGRVTEAGLEYARKLRDVKYYETIFGIIARQFEMAKLDEAKQGTLIQVVDPAIPPDKRSFPKRSLIVIGATAAGFLIGIFIAFFQVGMTRLKADPEMNIKLAFLGNLLAFKRSKIAFRKTESS
jgi:tyrosine-protein kinase Etk/Wzc